MISKKGARLLVLIYLGSVMTEGDIPAELVNQLDELIIQGYVGFASDATNNVKLKTTPRGKRIMNAARLEVGA